MQPKALEKWIWVLIYGGLLTLFLGLFMVRGASAVGWPLLGAGGVSAALGVVLIFVRSRM